MEKQIVTGHELEVAEIERQKATPEFRVSVLRGVAEMIAGAANTLASAAAGTLVETDSVFGPYCAEQQIADAELTLSRAAGILDKHL